MSKNSVNHHLEEVAEEATSSGETPQDTNKVPGISRRNVLIGGGIAALAGIGIGGMGGFAYGKSKGEAAGEAASDVMKISYPFRGKHQPGILTPQQQQMMMAAYDLTTESRELVIQLLKDWSLAAERMMAGNPVNDPKVSKLAPPDDTGEAYDLGPGALTMVLGKVSS